MALLRDEEELISGFNNEDLVFERLSSLYEDGLGEMDRSKFICKNNKVIYKGNMRVKINKRLIETLEIPRVTIKKVTGNFECAVCTNITSLKGAPEKVGEGFFCECCNNLISLEGAPRKVKKVFNCACCDKLKTLHGAPQKVEGYFSCNFCSGLETLEGAPEWVGGDFSCRFCNNVKNMNPKTVICGEFIED